MACGHGGCGCGHEREGDHEDEHNGSGKLTRDASPSGTTSCCGGSQSAGMVDTFASTSVPADRS